MKTHQRLLLFDIDGTLLDTGGAGAGALLDAAEEVLQVSREHLPPLDLAGATDGAVIRKLFLDSNLEYCNTKVSQYWIAYLRFLADRMQSSSTGRLHSGVRELLTALSDDSRFSIGLLTGNIRKGASIKLEHFGIHPHFVDGGFGDDGEIRNELAPIALQRMQTATGRQFQPEEIIVIGDTPKDIACAAALGARCLAVSTGIFDSTSLASHSPWLIRDDLADTQVIVNQLAA